VDTAGLQLHQYATGRYEGHDGGAHFAVSAHTDYPRTGAVRVLVEDGPAGRPWTLSLRIPQWAAHPRVLVAGQPTAGVMDDGWLRLRRAWSPGDEVLLELDMSPRLVRADARVDAVRGCVAIERGPLVYCLEGVDHPGGGLDDVVIDPTRPLTETERPELLGGVTTVTAAGHRRAPQDPGWWPYQPYQPDRLDQPAEPDRPDRPDRPHPPAGDASPPVPPPGSGLTLTAVPYYAWANRQDGPMRVWIPTR
ncbi:glycoside hydrolase family 127 protein, partial [Streptomyces sp. PRB2-1]|nr:glycoside hydrolase family 127 protein [Actinacidiphila epipremni]